MALPKVSCAYCNKILDAATASDETATPSEGDLSVCIHCGGVHFFTKELTLRKMTVAEFKALPEGTQNEVRKFQRVIRRNQPGSSTAW
jgi:hypothetical protein